MEQEQLDQILNCTDPFLIGVRHHSAALAAAIPAMLDDFQPDCVLIELPAEFADWMPWLAHDELRAPVALAGCSDDQFDLSFYPFADFSPELAAIRWAVRNKVDLRPCDLPMAERTNREDRTLRDYQPTGLLDAMLRKTQTTDVGSLWERLVESPAAGASPEALRRSGLMFGWALRSNDQVASNEDRRREFHMRQCIEDVGDRCAVVIGAYHAAALLPEPLLWTPPDDSLDPTVPNPLTQKTPADRQIATALIPYSFEQFDERSGYPAGIRDPHWHQRVFESSDVHELQHVVADMTVGVCRELRAEGHPINVADGKEVVRMSLDLAGMRSLAVPGRGELIEALQTCLARGEVMGIGRAVAKAMESVLVGTRRGDLPVDAPRSGLAPHVKSLIAELKLPGPKSLGDKPKQMRLDPLRSRLDRARVVTFERMSACGIPYAKLVETDSGSSRENLTEVWDVSWQHATAAMIELSAARGATLRQAALGAIKSDGLKADIEDWTTEHLGPLMTAARCGLPEVLDVGLAWLMGPFALHAGLPDLTRGMEFIERLRSGHIAGLPSSDKDGWTPYVQTFALPESVTATPLLQAAIAQVEGLIGSTQIEDAAALLDLILWFQQQGESQHSVDSGRLIWAIGRLARDGSPLMQGAGEAALLLLGQSNSDTFGQRMSGWIDGGVDRKTRTSLGQRLKGALFVSAPRLETEVSCLNEPERRIDDFEDDQFLLRLPAMRGGFDVLSPAGRARLLRTLIDRLPEDAPQQSARASSSDDPELTAIRFSADEAGRLAVAQLMPDLELETSLPAADEDAERVVLARPGRQLSLRERWRLILGVPQDAQSPSGMCAGAARALDELYGSGRGEGQRGGLGGGAGQESPYPGVREWAEELQQLFGEDVREEVLGEALSGGRVAALTVLDEESVTPSIDLLETVLSMKGAVPESHMDQLRRLAKRISDHLARELATRLQPALTGLSTPRPTRRPTPRLDLQRTVRANLHTARKDKDGRHTLVPEQMIFRGVSKRSMDWHVIFVVDVSGSMEASVIYSAMMAAILSGLPALSVQFLAFSTEVIDFTDRVDDPLAMLLEVQVGGGTHIAKGLRAARERLRVPARSIVLTVSDFEEGFPVSDLLGEVQTLVGTGATSLGLAALNDDGKPNYNKAIASQIVSCGMPVAALSPSELARWIGEQVK